jgi:sulfane dehydrogenase subunit SoxC
LGNSEKPGRRLFLKRGLVLGGAAALAPSLKVHAGADREQYPPWMREPGQPFTNYGEPSPYEKRAIRWVSANPMAEGNGVSWTPLHDLAGMITPNPLHFERHHNGVPAIDPKRHRLQIDGLVRKPLIFSVEALLRYPRVSRLCFIECGGNSNAGWRPRPIQTRAGYFHGLVSCSEWTGVPLALLLREAGIDARAGWLVAEGADAAGISVSLPLAKAMDDVIVALYQNGERVRPENGYPMRLVVPGWEGIVNVKWLRRLKLVSEPSMSRYETSRYTDLLPNGKARQFSFQMEAKSLITYPSPGFDLPEHGLYEIRGMAWSGAGRISRVDVSVDGGVNWSVAELQGPVLPACLTRFRLPWRWSGQQAVLLSRAVDESGYVQPTRQSLLEARGEHGYYHYNAMVSWQISKEGQVRHVYI